MDESGAAAPAMRQSSGATHPDAEFADGCLDPDPQQLLPHAAIVLSTAALFLACCFSLCASAAASRRRGRAALRLAAAGAGAALALPARDCEGGHSLVGLQAVNAILDMIHAWGFPPLLTIDCFDGCDSPALSAAWALSSAAAAAAAPGASAWLPAAATGALSAAALGAPERRVLLVGAALCVAWAAGHVIRVVRQLIWPARGRDAAAQEQAPLLAAAGDAAARPGAPSDAAGLEPAGAQAAPGAGEGAAPAGDDALEGRAAAPARPGAGASPWRVGVAGLAAGGALGCGAADCLRWYEATSGRLFKTSESAPNISAAYFVVHIYRRRDGRGGARGALTALGLWRPAAAREAAPETATLSDLDAAGFVGACFRLWPRGTGEGGAGGDARGAFDSEAGGGGGAAADGLVWLFEPGTFEVHRCRPLGAASAGEPMAGVVEIRESFAAADLVSAPGGARLARGLVFSPPPPVGAGGAAGGPGLPAAPGLCLVDVAGGDVIAPWELSLLDACAGAADELGAWRRCMPGRGSWSAARRARSRLAAGGGACLS